MKFKRSVVIIFGLIGSSFSIPDCLKAHQTCPLNTKQLSVPPFPLPNWEDCRDSCNAQENCTSFTFFDGRGVPFKRMCFLFKQKCPDSEVVYCEGCYSGHQCHYCSIEGMAFSMDGGNLLGMFSETDEESCRKKCAEDEKCSYYTIHLADRYLMPNTCTLISASSKPEVCKSCRTGPKACNFYENCKPNEAVIMSASNLSSSLKIETNETIKIDTMGCTVKANLLAVGGGGTGGRDSFSSSATRYGGGGSGFLDFSIISIPFTKRFFTYVGKGWEKGSDAYSRESSSYTSHRVSYYDEYADHFAEPQEQSNLKSTSNYYAGQNTMVISEDGEVIADAKGGEGGYSTAGGDGFSGGGSEGGQCGGSNGDNGGSSNQDKGGNGSGIDIRRDVQPLFREFELEPAPGGKGSTKSSSRVASGGGGGGGVFVNGRSYSYGQGGDGYDSSRPPHGNSGVILFEIQF